MEYSRSYIFQCLLWQLVRLKYIASWGYQFFRKRIQLQGYPWLSSRKVKYWWKFYCVCHHFFKLFALYCILICFNSSLITFYRRVWTFILCQDVKIFGVWILLFFILNPWDVTDSGFCWLPQQPDTAIQNPSKWSLARGAT